MMTTRDYNLGMAIDHQHYAAEFFRLYQSAMNAGYHRLATEHQEAASQHYKAARIYMGLD